LEVATAGVGIAIPVIPIEFTSYGEDLNEKKLIDNRNDPFGFEKSPKGKLGIGYC
jgi:hypothetical protein